MQLDQHSSARALVALLALGAGACASAREAAPSAPVEPSASVEPAANEATAGDVASSGAGAAPVAEPSAAPAPPSHGEPTAPVAGSADCDAHRARIDARLTEASRCSTDADCTTLMPGCPFGCYRAVQRGTDTAALEADIQAYNQSCSACVYRCRALEQAPTCRSGRCSIE